MRTLLLLLFTLVEMPYAHASYEWRPWPGGTEAALMDRGVQVGAWNVLGGYYRALHADGTWGPRLPLPPVPPPEPNFGIDESRLSAAPRYTINGQAVERQAIERAIADIAAPRSSGRDERIPDLAAKRRLTVIGPPALTKAVLDDLASHQALAPHKDSFVAAAYEPAHWHIAQAGFVTSGQPTIYVQDSTGKILHRQDDYAGGAVALAEALTKLRKPRPDYVPQTDPDHRKRSPLPKSLLVLGGLGAGAWYLTRRKKS